MRPFWWFLYNKYSRFLPFLQENAEDEGEKDGDADFRGRRGFSKEGIFVGNKSGKIFGGTRELVELCAGEFSWKRTTTYTMLKRLCQRGIFENQGGMIKVLISREDFHAAQGEEFLKESFDGSLPHFLAAFTRRRALSSREIQEIRKLIDEFDEERKDEK